MCSTKSSHALRISRDVKKCLSLEIIEVHGWMWDLQMLTGEDLVTSFMNMWKLFSQS